LEQPLRLFQQLCLFSNEARWLMLSSAFVGKILFQAWRISCNRGVH